MGTPYKIDSSPWYNMIGKQKKNVTVIEHRKNKNGEDVCITVRTRKTRKAITAKQNLIPVLYSMYNNHTTLLSQHKYKNISIKNAIMEGTVTL